MQKQRLVDLLAENCRPDNRTYLYNFLYDNCSTRVRDILEKATSQKIQWHLPDEDKSFWNLLDEYLHRMPWVKWGIHTILAQPGNQTATPYQYMFLPDYLEEGLASATLDGAPLVNPTEVLFEEEPVPLRNPWYLSPLFVFCVAALLITGVLHRYRNRRLLSAVALLLFLASGLIGVLLIFLGGFTEHPMTAPNYNLVWANPLNLLILPWLFRKQLPRFAGNYLQAYTWLLAAGIPLWFIVQPSVPYASLPLLLLLIYLSARVRRRN